MDGLNKAAQSGAWGGRPGARSARPAGQARRRGFTLVELMFTVAVLILLIGLLIVGLRVASRIANKAVEQQTVAALVLGCEQFKQDFRFAPPLIEDDNGAPSFKSGTDQRVGPLFSLNSAPYEPVAFLSTTDQALRFPKEERYLRGRDPGENNTPLKSDYRFSTYSLSYYLLGVLGKDPSGKPAYPPVDGVEGAGFLQPNIDGTFRKTGGKKFEPIFDTSKGTKGVIAIDDPNKPGRFELRDRRGVPYRYYAWRHGRQYNGPAFPTEVREPADLNIPRLLGDPADNPALRNAEYAIVAAGANTVFGDWWGPGPTDGTETPTAIKTGLGVSLSMDDDKAARMGREDNIVGVGR